MMCVIILLKLLTMMPMTRFRPQLIITSCMAGILMIFHRCSSHSILDLSQVSQEIIFLFHRFILKILEENLWWWFHFLGILFLAVSWFSILYFIPGMLACSGYRRFMFSLVVTHFSVLPCKFWHWILSYYFLPISSIRFGYIGDVTSTKERTAIIAILGALGFVMMPLADFCGGQIYKAGGFLPVYITSLAFVFCGLFYIWLIPESITKRSHVNNQDVENIVTEENMEKPNIFQRLWRFFKETNKIFVETFKYVFR